MQAAGTLRGTRAILSLLVLLVPLISYAYSNPIQYLPSIPGYIPVYIRYGDEPLAGINPDLAEAFGETSNSVKSLQKIDHTLIHGSDNFKDDDIDTFLEESKEEHAYPLHVRAAESRSFATVNDDSGNPNKPKLLNIYQLPDDDDDHNDNRRRRRYRGRSRVKNFRKRPALKVNPLSEEEREELEKLAIEVEKEETKPNEFYAPNPKYSGLYKSQNFVAPIKVQIPFDDSLTNLPKIPQSNDFSQFLDQDVFETGKQEPPIKEQRPSTILSNVDKISPIDLPNESETNEHTISEGEKIKKQPLTIKAELPEIPRDMNLSKSQNEHNTATEADKEGLLLNVQRPVTVLSNVDKISPIDLPDESTIDKDNKTKNCN
ncbi:LOW QUALITY PROTEIN: uncharacterized protein LOC105428930 [Pogonomyrmex barbatus]|uniref:LOW QUALITY PROTEIN: uncharacterized protein LOC105428930 n=1 Tax=Pogonomyrmex barbatus TaxID=144034 RepID=A0A6I9X5Y5_9HYME|nr:LOW QUALITY PROTEIN: uncharacterized protein LOC105428930 [Pogonomyrmex barbatus]